MNDKLDSSRPAAATQALEQAALLLGLGDDNGLYGIVLAAAAQITGAGQVGLWALGPEPDRLRLVTSQEGAETISAVHAPDGLEALPASIVEQALNDGQIHFSAPESDPARGMALPLRSGGRAVGLIYAQRCTSSLTDSRRTTLQALADMAGSALDRAALRASLATTEQARRDFVSLTTHQLRVPLTSISGYTDLMLGGLAGTLSERQEQFMLTVRRNVDRMTLLIADLSDLNRIQDGRMRLEIGPIDMKALVDSILNEQADHIRTRNHRVIRQLPDGLPPALGDRAAVRRVLEKLLDNAILYTPEGGTLTIAVFYNERRLQATVADSGMGIAPEDQPRLFTPFFRSEVEAVRAHVGWGLSLALARALLEAQSGELWYESEPGAGAIFHIALPVAGTGKAGPSS